MPRDDLLKLSIRFWSQDEHVMSARQTTALHVRVRRLHRYASYTFGTPALAMDVPKREDKWRDEEKRQDEWVSPEADLASSRSRCMAHSI